MNIFEKIKIYKKENANLDENKIDELVKDVALDCLQHIVSNEELNGHASGAWWTILETYNLEIDKECQLLPLNRGQDTEINKSFNNACGNEDIEGIKEGLKKFARINKDNETSVLTDAILSGNLKTFKFFIEDPFVNYNPILKCQVGFDKIKGLLFENAYFYEKLEFITYLINEHNVETTIEAKQKLKNDDSDFKNKVIKLIENKYLNLMLDLTLEKKEIATKNNKI